MAPVHAADWQMVKESSRLEFTAYYDGEAFQGRFEQFDMTLFFDPADPSAATLEVRVDTRSVDTDNSDRDTALADPEWFDFAGHPEAIYKAKQFESIEGDNYRASGELTLKSHTAPVPIEFEFRQGQNEAKLSGTATMIGGTHLNRMTFGIGIGEWEDPVIGHRVEIHFDLTLKQ